MFETILKIFFSKKKKKYPGNKIPLYIRKLMKNKKSISKKLLRTRDEIKLFKLRSDIDCIERVLYENLEKKDIEIEKNILPKISENPRIFYKYAKFKAKTCENIGPLQN